MKIAASGASFFWRVVFEGVRARFGLDFGWFLGSFFNDFFGQFSAWRRLLRMWFRYSICCV